jgi:V/A-type H+-transporting ATPase subunit A
MSVELGPGLIGSIYDGIQRPLDEIMRALRAATCCREALKVPALKRDKSGISTPTVKRRAVIGGDILGTCSGDPYRHAADHGSP